MMFSSVGLFKSIRCPNGDRCRLTNCIFSHEHRGADGGTKKEIPDSAVITAAPEIAPPVKRRRTQDADIATVPREDPSELHSQGKGGQASDTQVVKTPGRGTALQKRPSQGPHDADLPSIVRPVSPPSVAKAKNGAAGSKHEHPVAQSEALNPRMIPNDPAGHGKRMVYLTALHKELHRLNDALGKDADQQVRRLHLSDADLTKAALDEEERFAREQPAVYANVIKLQIVKYRKMTQPEWLELRRTTEQAKQAGGPRRGKTIDTGLSAAEEVMMLRRMVADKEGLDQWGYVASPPTEKDIEGARAGVEASGGYETCDRCATRFQIFPDRREDGLLASGGKCVHHWGRPFHPKRQKTDAQTGQQEPRYTCCNELLGSRGCSEAPTHVYKISEAKRLAAILPFEETPMGSKDSAVAAVCFDCEMGYTVHGLELIRITAVSWPEGKPLLDTLVRPTGAILDLNSRFSGVFPEHMAKAKDFDIPAWRARMLSTKAELPRNASDADSEDLGIVSSPASARALLGELLDHHTLIVGHALENDLNAVRLVHPNIVDTVFLFPHPRGLPYRFGLRQLALQYLERHIQTTGAAGHSSLEDARATGDVARWKVKTEWDKLRLAGWTVKDGQFFAPVETNPDGSPSVLPEWEGRGRDLSRSRKRKRRQSTGTGGVDGDDPQNGSLGDV